MAIAIGMECDLEETQSVLRIASLACLDPRNQKDTIIIYGILHHFTMMEINEVLFDLEESLLCTLAVNGDSIVILCHIIVRLGNTYKEI